MCSNILESSNVFSFRNRTPLPGLCSWSHFTLATTRTTECDTSLDIIRCLYGRSRRIVRRYFSDIADHSDHETSRHVSSILARINRPEYRYLYNFINTKGAERVDDIIRTIVMWDIRIHPSGLRHCLTLER